MTQIRVSVMHSEPLDDQNFYTCGRNGMWRYRGIAVLGGENFQGVGRAVIDLYHSRGYVSGGGAIIPIEDMDKLAMEWLRARGIWPPKEVKRFTLKGNNCHVDIALTPEGIIADLWEEHGIYDIELEDTLGIQWVDLEEFQEQENDQ